MENRHLEVTTLAGCKVSCSYCPQELFALEHKKVSSNRYLSLDLFKTCLETVPVSVDIHFSGYVETFLNPDCVKMVRHAYDKGHQVAVYTTVVGVKLEDVEELEKMTFKKFIVHLPDDGKHMRVKVDAPYLEVIQRLANSNIPNLEYLDYYGIHPKVNALINQEQVVQRKLTSRAGNVTREFVNETKEISGALRCRVNRLEKNVLLPNGDVSLCCVDYGRRHVLGNLTSESYNQLHQNDAFKEILRRMNGKKGDLLCRTCEWAEPVTFKIRAKKLLKKIKILK
jgi:radical SAM protein with 4Fe4S-binding SPASM domain